ncbi:MAG: Hsp33 family molecular chaperone HslO [Candidatus Izemoplasmatales bacterium]|nr:Hsp33 family molecular chaperone HslO [bacterium]MDZ4197335.1 Hsp33 family molecular chaperone HslO [Candidatus Izemoplasmatales bacterium]
MKDYLVKAYAFDGTVRIYGATTTQLVEHARQIHDTWPAATAAFGRVLTAGIIMGAMYKGDQTLTIRINGGGPIGDIIAVTSANGTIRGYVQEPHVHMSTNDDKLAVGHVVGSDGFIHITKDLKVRDVFTSSAELRTGEIAEDFTYYFAMSEQIPSAVGLGVLVNDDNSVLSSGGYILQVMPGAKEATLQAIEANIKSMKPVSELIHLGYTPEMIVSQITKEDHEFIEYLDLSYACDCHKDKFEKGLLSLGSTELTSLISEKNDVEIICRFCGKKYNFTIPELQTLEKIASHKEA